MSDIGLDEEEAHRILKGDHAASGSHLSLGARRLLGRVPDAAGFSAAGATFAEVQQLAREGLAFYFDEPVEVTEVFKDFQPAWSVTSKAQMIEADSPLWGRALTAATDTAGAARTGVPVASSRSGHSTLFGGVRRLVRVQLLENS